jgi:hypothetical protein
MASRTPVHVRLVDGSPLFLQRGEMLRGIVGQRDLTTGHYTTRCAPIRLLAVDVGRTCSYPSV